MAEVITAQPGPQTEFLSCPADICVFGGAAGGGKSFSLLLDPLRFVHHPHFSAVIFRRTNPEIVNPGGLWDEAMKIYPGLGAEGTKHNLTFRFPSGATIKLAHLQYDQDMYSWQGSQICYIGWDEVTHFTASVFWYLFSRQRNPYGIPSLIRATCNPDPDSFIAELISWWIDQKTGLPIKERSGKIRFFVRVNDTLIWDDSAENLKKQFPKLKPKSFTFIPSSLKDNKILTQMDENYEANLLAMPTVERERLLGGNWKIRAAAGLYFKKSYFQVIEKEELPILTMMTRGWDLAASPDPKIEKAKAKKEPDSTAAVLMGKDKHGQFYILDLVYGMFTPAVIDKLMKDLAQRDGRNTIVRIPQDPGQAGKYQLRSFAKLLVGYTLRSRTMTGDKVTRAGAFSSACENGLVTVVRGTWNDLFFQHLEAFPPSLGSPDIVDACVEAFDELTKQGRGVVVKPIAIRIDNDED